jgi:hypothetical protein
MVIFSILAFEVGGTEHNIYKALRRTRRLGGGVRVARETSRRRAPLILGDSAPASGRLRLGDRAQSVRFDLEREVDEVVVVLHRVQPCDLDDLPVAEVLA